MDIGAAIKLAKQGKRVAREAWNGKGMWVSYSPGSENLPAANFWSAANQEFAEYMGGSANVLPCLTMKTTDSAIQMGWLASQADLLAEDWEVVG